MYIYLSDNRTVVEIIPDENPIFPGVPIEKRYSPDFIQKLMHVPDSTKVEQNWIYEPEMGSFSRPINPDI